MPMVWVPKKKLNSPEERKTKLAKDPDTYQNRYSDAFKLSVVSTYLQTGRNLLMTSRLVGIDKKNLYLWKQTDWWKEFEQDLIDQSYQQTNNKLQQVLDKSLNELMDRLHNGDTILDSKTGKLRKVPMKGREVNRIVNDNITKQVLLNNIQKEKVQKKNETTQQDRLLKLAEEFAKIAVSGAPNAAKNVKSLQEIHDEAQAKVHGNVIEPLQDALKPLDDITVLNSK